MPRILCLGNAVIDRIFEVDAIPARPVKVIARAFREGGGGIAATAAVAIARLGGDASWWGRLGDDAVGRRVHALLAAQGVDVGDVRLQPGAASATAAVIVDRAGERLLAAFPGRGLDDDPSWLPLERVASAAAVLVDARWRQGTEALLDAAASHGVARVIDLDLGDRETLLAMAARTDHAIFSAPALARASGSDDPESGLRAVAPRAAGLVGVTLGERGAMWLDSGRLGTQPAFAVAASDTTGAGDVFHGAYALALAEGRDVAAAMRFAAAAGALKVRNGRGWDGMPSRAEVDRMIEGVHA